MMLMPFSEYLKHMPDCDKESLLRKARRFSTNLSPCPEKIADVVEDAKTEVLISRGHEIDSPSEWFKLVSRRISGVTANTFRKEFDKALEDRELELVLLPDSTNSRNAFLSALQNSLPAEARLLLPNQALGPHRKFRSRAVAIEVVDADLNILQFKLIGLGDKEKSFRIKQVLSAKIQLVDEVATGFVEQQDLDNKKNEGSAQIRFNPAKSQLLNCVEANSYLCCRVQTRSYRRKQIQADDEIQPLEQEPDNIQVDPFELASKQWFDILAKKAKLTDDETSVLYMLYVEGMNCTEIAYSFQCRALSPKCKSREQVYELTRQAKNKIRTAFPDGLSD